MSPQFFTIPELLPAPQRAEIGFCGFRVRQGVVLPSARKLARFRAGARVLAEAAQDQAVAARQAQRAHDVLAATLTGIQSARFRQRVCVAVGGYSCEL